ncbi:MAG TPA: dihydrodipicolinate synthase family protein [Vicinamibacterales bacterium]
MTGIRGIVPIVNTPFHDDGTLDLASQRRLVRFLVESGAHALGLFGNASEGYTLTEEERRILLRVIVKEVDGRVPLVVSSGHTGTDAAVWLSKEAQDAGAAALMVLPPYYMKTDGDGLLFYFDAISKAVSIPIMVQDAPAMTGVTMSPELLARLGREVEHVKLVKVEAPPTAGKIARLHALADGSLELLGGLNGHFLLEELERGAVGTMPGCDMTDAFLRVWQLWTDGDREAARREFDRMLPLIRYELQPGMGVAVMKRNLCDAGIIASARVRHPTRTLDAMDIADVRRLRQPLELRAFATR